MLSKVGYIYYYLLLEVVQLKNKHYIANYQYIKNGYYGQTIHFQQTDNSLLQTDNSLSTDR